ncbi:chemotaxis protein [Bifidobacterium longum]|nr:chemotaxis protein [Bifidobacterium longum]
MTEQNPSKMGWYIHRTSKVTRSTCGNDGSQTYHVEYKMTNTLENSQIGALTSYILGSGGQGVEKTLIYAPAGGSISNLKTSGGSVTESRQETLNGKTVYASNATIAPGESVTYSFDVATSTKAVSGLTIDQTPMGWTDSGVTTDTAVCSINSKKSSL